jgi:hypothetical protein
MQGQIVDTRDGRRRSFRWSAGTIKFGSGVDADLVLAADGIRPRHGSFQLAPDGCHVKVEADAPPVELNGMSTRDATLQVGDVVRVGPFQVAFSETAAPAPAPAAPAAPPPVARAAVGHAAASSAAAPARVAAPAYAARSAEVPVGTSRERLAAAAASGDSAALTEERRARAQQRMKAKMAGKGANSEGMKVVAIISGVIAIIWLGWSVFGSGSSWSHMGDNFKAHCEAARQAVRRCDFDAADQKMADLRSECPDNDDSRAQLADVAKFIADTKVEYVKAKQDLEVLRNRLGIDHDKFVRYANIYINSYYQRFEPLCKEADKLVEMSAKGYTPPPNAAPAPTAEATDTRDFSAGAGPSAAFKDRKQIGGTPAPTPAPPKKQ